MLLSLPLRQDPKPTAVQQLMLYVTEECNLRCTYCFVDKQPRHMTQATANKAVDFLLSPETSGQEPSLFLNFFGGEPFLCPDLVLETILYARKMGAGRIQFGATTNGTLAGAGVQRAIQEGGIRLLISLDGDAESHSFRPKVSGSESWSHLQKNLRKLISWSPETAIRMTYHPGSFQLLSKVQAALELGARWIVLCPVVEADWTGLESKLREESERLTDWFLAEFHQGRQAPLEMHWRFLVNLITREDTSARPLKACPVGDTLLAIDTAGNVLPCHRYLYRKQERLGHVQGHTQRISDERWRYVHLTRAETPECPQCIAKTVCGGGCRVVAQEAGYSLQGVHPNHCMLTRMHVEQIQRIDQSLRGHPRFLEALLSYVQMPKTFQEAEPIIR